MTCAIGAEVQGVDLHAEEQQPNTRVAPRADSERFSRIYLYTDKQVNPMRRSSQVAPFVNGPMGSRKRSLDP